MPSKVVKVLIWVGVRRAHLGECARRAGQAGKCRLRPVKYIFNHKPRWVEDDDSSGDDASSSASDAWKDTSLSVCQVLLLAAAIVVPNVILIAGVSDMGIGFHVRMHFCG